MDEELKELVIEMAQGNPGAVSVLVQLAQQPGGALDILELKRQDCRGPLIWIRYKDVCGEDIAALRANIRVTADEHEATAPPSA